jgi:predicted phosphoribosyltransferase
LALEDKRLIKVGMVVRIVSLLRDKNLSGALGVIESEYDAATSMYRVVLDEGKDSCSISAANLHVITKGISEAERRVSISRRRSNKTCGVCGGAITLAIDGIATGKAVNYARLVSCEHEFHKQCIAQYVFI